jgi:hypothetical protein
MLKIISNNKLLFIGIHVFIGFLADKRDLFLILFSLSILAFGAILIIRNGNKNEEAILMSSYLVGVEVFFRMIRASVLYEFGKYGVLFFLLLGLFLGPVKQKLNILFILYLLLLALGIVLTEVPEGESIRKAIAFNLSGPILLGVAAFYFYKRPVSKKILFEGLFFMLLPIFSMVSFMYFRTPDLGEIIFSTASNARLSGGFGPNQVATILGVGIFIIAIFLLLKIKLTGLLILDAFFLLYFTYRGLITFSRGGIITAAIAFLVFSFIFLYHKGTFQNIIKYLLLLVVFSTSVWLYTSSITGGMLDNRYQGKDAAGRQKDITTGRADVIITQLESFYEAPLFGIGVGNGKYKRESENSNITAASHNEVTRLIEEHGLIGIIILMILFLIPLEHFYYSTIYQRAFVSAFVIFWFLTINHTAMRIAFPSFIYGLSLIHIIGDEKE